MSLAQRLVMEAVQLGIAVLKGGDPATQRSLYNKLQTADMIVVCFKVFHDQQRKSGPLLLQTSRPNYCQKYWPCCPSSASSSSSARTTTATCRISFAPSQTRAAITSCQRRAFYSTASAGDNGSASTSTSAAWPSSTRRWKCSPDLCVACHENQNCIARPRFQLAGHYHGPYVDGH